MEEKEIKLDGTSVTLGRYHTNNRVTKVALEDPTS